MGYIIHAVEEKVPEIPKNPEIAKMLKSPTNDHLLRLSMLLLRKFLIFQKFKKLPYNHSLNRFISNLSENVTKVPKIPKNPEMPFCSGQLLMVKDLPYVSVIDEIIWEIVTRLWKKFPKFLKLSKNWSFFVQICQIYLSQIFLQS